MVFLPKDCAISSNVVNQVADDIIEIAEIAKNREDILRGLMEEHLRCSNSNVMLTEYDINNMIRAVKSSSPHNIGRILKSVSKKLDKQYAQLSTIMKGLR